MSIAKWNTCPICAAKLVLDDGGTFVRCGSCDFVYYGNPSPTTVALIVADGPKVLLVRRAIEPRSGFWDTVGGFVDAGETAEDCLRREVKEELGTDIAHLEPLRTYSSTYGGTDRVTLGFAFVCRLTTEAIRLSEENLESAWFAFDALPEMAFADGSDSLRDLVEEWPRIAERFELEPRS